MSKQNTIYVHEHGTLIVGETYNNVVFKDELYLLLSKYITDHPKPNILKIYHKRVKFTNYVGVIKLGSITIEVLPKTDRHDLDTEMWQTVLLDMLAISLQVEAKTTNLSDIQIRRHTVLETYIELFINEVRVLMHRGLISKYRKEERNRSALKGKLLIHKNVVKNLVHAERFFVEHVIYDKDNVYNGVLQEALSCIKYLNISDSINKLAESLLIDFPDCKKPKVSEKLFAVMSFDRKTESYKTAIQLARIILLNFHPDITGGSNNVLAIMFDMNRLWENYVYWILRRESITSKYTVSVTPQPQSLFWQHFNQINLKLKPDLIVTIGTGDNQKTYVLDTKWKYQSGTSMEDVRQMYAYTNYFVSDEAFLVYPENLSITNILIRKGSFFPGVLHKQILRCGLIFVDLLRGNQLNHSIAAALVESLVQT